MPPPRDIEPKKPTGREPRISGGIGASTDTEFEAIFETLPDAVIFVDRTRHITRTNRAYTDIFGYTDEESRGRTTEFLYANRRDYCATGRTRYNCNAPKDGAPYVLEYRRRDGSTFMGQTTGAAVLDPEGEVIGFMGVTRDVSEERRLDKERQRAQSQLHRQQELLEEMCKMARIGAAELDAKTLELTWSKQMYELFDLQVGNPPTYEQALGLFTEDAAGKLEQAVRAALDQGVSYELELPLAYDASGMRWVRTVGMPRHRNGRIVGLYGFVQDITLYKELSAVVSHEMRTPLTSLQGALGLLANGTVGQLPPAAAPLIDVCLRSSTRLSALVDDILDVDRLEGGRLKLYPVAIVVDALVAEIVHANQTLADDHGVQLRAEVHAPGAQVYVDPERLEQVLTNLISNAFKFSPEGSKVTLATQLVDATVCILVTDDGGGIPEDFQPRIFEKFAQANGTGSERLPGSGLGLAGTTPRDRRRRGEPSRCRSRPGDCARADRTDGRMHRLSK